MNLKVCLLLLVLGSVGAMTLLTLRPSTGVAPESGFSSTTALRHLRFIASAPRHRGSPHHRAVREYLIDHFRALAMDVQVQDTFVSSRRLHGLRFQVMNVIARLRGTSGRTDAIVLAAHYDTTPASLAPGAGDDGAAVAALVEVASVLARDRPANDVIFLLTDAEESGLLGARAFADEHAWREDVGVIFNFEARGTSGPSIMFETSPGNSFLVDQFARVAPHPVTSSLSSAVYRMMPNDTDFTIFLRQGWRGLNFAFIDDYANYHTLGDSLENFDLRSMRHHGVQALALARHFGQLDLARIPETGDAIYFNVFNLGVVRYPATWAIPLAACSVLGGVVAIALAARCGMIRFKGVLWGIGILALSLVLAVAIAWALVRLLPIAPMDRRSHLAIAGFALIALACLGLMLFIFQPRAHPLDLAAASLVPWGILALVVSFYISGGSYLLAWPTIALAIALGISAWLGRARWDSGLGPAIMAAGAVPVALLLTPISYLVFLGFRVQLAPVVISLVMLGLWHVAPILSAPGRGWLRVFVPLSAVGSAICVIIAALG